MIRVVFMQTPFSVFQMETLVISVPAEVI